MLEDQDQDFSEAIRSMKQTVYWLLFTCNVNSDKKNWRTYANSC